MTESSDLYDLIVTDAMLDNGASPAVLASRGSVIRGKKGNGSPTLDNQMPWTEEEDLFLQENLGRIPMKEIAKSLGRSINALKIRFTRKGYKTPTKIDGWVTSNKAAKLLGLDSHTVPNWFRLGMIPGRYAYTSNSEVIMIKLSDLKLWITRPYHWPYFKVDRMPPGHLRRLVEKAQERWGDEWLTTSEVAQMHGLKNCRIVLSDIQKGRLPAIQCRHIGGRDGGSWAFWFVRKSDAISYHHPSKSDSRKSAWFSERAEEYLRQLVAEGKTCADAAKLMKRNEKSLSYRMVQMRKELS